MKQIKKLDPKELWLRSDIIEAGLTRKINELVDVINLLLTKTPNIGETPEVDNTEGQIDKILKNLSTARSFLTNKSIVNSDLHSDAYFNVVIKQLKELNKPVETDKEKPFTSNELKTLMESVLTNPKLQRDCAMNLHSKLLTLYKGL